MRIRAKKSVCLSRHNHPSMSEADYCNTLYALLQEGRINAFKYQDKVELFINGRRFADWAIDFVVEELDGTHTWHECKGYNLSDDNFRLKKDAFLLCYPNRRLYVNWIPAKLYETPGKMRKRILKRIDAQNDYRERVKQSQREYRKRGALIKKQGLAMTMDYTKGKERRDV